VSYISGCHVKSRLESLLEDLSFSSVLMYRSIRVEESSRCWRFEGLSQISCTLHPHISIHVGLVSSDKLLVSRGSID
jgi:hypothetical protein